MSKKLIFISSLIFILVAASVATFYANFEQYPEKVWHAPKAEAETNQFLALEYLMQKLGRQPLRLQTFNRLTSAQGGVLLLAAQQTSKPYPAIDKLFLWVKAGGHLVIERAPPQIATIYGLKFCTPKLCNEPEKNKTGQTNGTSSKQKPLSELLLNQTRYKLNSDNSWIQPLADTPPIVQLTDQFGHTRVVEYAMGKGHITFISSFELFTNSRLAKEDHAAFLWAITTAHQPKAPIYIISHLESPSALEWLWHSAWMVLVSLTLLVALWLWRVIPRFGGIYTETPLERRQLTEHLTALGHFIWKVSGPRYLLAPVQLYVRTKFIRKTPEARLGTLEAQYKHMARHSGLSQKEVAHAFATPANATPADFTRSIKTLQKIAEKI